MDHSVSEIIRNADGMRAFAQDATSSERLTTLEQSLDRLPIGITIYDDQFHLITWNEMAVDILRAPPGLLRKGMSPKELMPHLASIGFYDGASARSLVERRQEMDDGELSRESAVDDGRILELRGSRTPDGGYVYITQDVTAQRRAESVTKELAAVVESSEAAILGLSPDGVINSWNTGAENLYGYSAEEAIGQRARLLTGDAAQAEAQQTVWRKLLSGQRAMQSVAQRTHKDGHVFSVSLSMSPIFGDNGEVVGVSGVAHDITERLEAEQALADQRDELERLNAQKNRLFSIIAHDLRTPFNSLLGFSEILSKNAADLAPEDISGYARMMHQSAGQANALLENLLDWSRLQMGGLQSEPRPFDVAVAIEKALAFNTAGAAAKYIVIENLESPLLTVLADPRMVETVLRNLIGNAIKFTERGGAVSIKARRVQGEVVIAIRDNGIGIPPDRLAHLFSFESGASTVGTDGEKGTGLGLQLCKELIELQGGVLSVESTPGQGSTFRFTLPSAI